MSDQDSKSLSYKDAGVNIDAGNQLVERIKATSKATMRPEVMGNLGGFGALCELPTRYQNPVLVAGTDGVGTKLALAQHIGDHSTIGIDLVAMCVNDLIVQGAEPLFFLDYYATGQLNVETAEQVVRGIGEGCLQAGCALIGGETAEMPGMYQNEDYDLAGFCVGVVEKANIIDGTSVAAGDSLIALASSGAHSNGYSLIRKVLQHSNSSLNAPFAEDSQNTLGAALMQPTRIYIKSLLSLMQALPVKALAHITGGGLLENIPRVLPEHLSATIEQSSWEWPSLFKWLQEQGNIKHMEMLRTFNCGVGMVICIDTKDAETALEHLRDSGEHAWLIGQINSREGDQAVQFN